MGAVVGMGAVALITFNALASAGETSALVLAILAGGLVYGILILLFGAINSEDVSFLPGGKKLTRLLIALHIWRK